MLSQQDSPVRTFHSPGLAPDLPAPVRDSTGKWFEPFAWFDRDTLCWRTWQRSLVEGWEPFSETWPRSGMMRSGIAFRRAPLVPLTDETGSGLLPTPEASNTKAIALRSAGRSPRNFLRPIWPTPVTVDTGLTTDLAKIEARRQRIKAKGINGNGFGLSLGEAARLWPTPTAKGNYNRKGLSKTSGDGLATAVKLWRTPNASDARKWNNQSLEERKAKGQQIRLNTQVSPQGGAGGQLNPDWVEWLMGFPIGWTALKNWATRSSRKSPK